MASRRYARKNAFESPAFLWSIEQIMPVLLEYKNVALIGGLAVAYYANPPVTVDIDILIDERGASGASKLVKALEAAGWSTQPLWFPHRQKGLPRKGVKALKKKPYHVVIDLIFTGDDAFLRSVTKHAKEVAIDGDRILAPVVTAEDLIIMKSLVGRDKDLDDISDMYSELGDKLDVDYIAKKLEEIE